MKKTIRLYLFLLMAGMCGLQANGQAVKFTYDNSGNRTHREKIIVKAIPKSVASKGDDSVEAPPAEENTPLEEMLAETKITIYPNPTKGMLRVDITGKTIPDGARIYLYSASGTLIRQLTGLSATNDLDISAQPVGTYILRIVLDKENVSSWKIIKE